MYHKRGLVNRLSHFLIQAYQFYRISLDVLENHRIIAAKVDPLLHLALLNNQAHIAATLLRADEMRYAISCVKYVLEVDGDFVSEEDFEIFYKNAYCCPKEPIVAPAA
jgi:hypothetical protein